MEAPGSLWLGSVITVYAIIPTIRTKQSLVERYQSKTYITMVCNNTNNKKSNTTNPAGGGITSSLNKPTATSTTNNIYGLYGLSGAADTNDGSRSALLVWPDGQ